MRKVAPPVAPMREAVRKHTHLSRRGVCKAKAENFSRAKSPQVALNELLSSALADHLRDSKNKGIFSC